MLHQFPYIYGNTQLLGSSRLACCESVFKHQEHQLTKRDIEEIEEEAIDLVVYEHKILVTGIHNHAHQVASCIPLRFGSPRILILDFDPRILWVGKAEDDLPELFSPAILWRYWFDPLVDLILCTSLSPIAKNQPGKLVLKDIDESVLNLAGMLVA